MSIRLQLVLSCLVALSIGFVATGIFASALARQELVYQEGY